MLGTLLYAINIQSLETLKKAGSSPLQVMMPENISAMELCIPLKHCHAFN